MATVNDFFTSFEVSYPEFAKVIKDYYRYFLITENKYSLMKGTRDYELCNKIMKFMMDVFKFEHLVAHKLSDDVEKAKKNTLKYMNEHYKNFCSDIAEIQLAYLDRVIALKFSKPTDKEAKNVCLKEMKETFQKEANVRICVFGKMIDGIDSAPKIPKINRSDCENADVIELQDLTNMMYYFYCLIDIYEEFYKDEQKIKHVATYDAFTSEFHMFASHFILSFIAYKTFNTASQEYIITNINRALRHIERGAFDVIKILVSSLASSNVLKSEELVSLISIRQEEIINISLPIKDRMKNYLEWMLNTNYVGKRDNIQKLISNTKNIIQ